jgi:heme/copper-type cytochrome/quinol oxidase subunit 2
MTTAMGDLLFWIVALIALFFVLRYFQNKKNKDDKDQ